MARMRWWHSIAGQLWVMVLLCALFFGALIFVNTRAEIAHEQQVVGDALFHKGTSAAQALSSQLLPSGETATALQGLLQRGGITASGPGCLAPLRPLVQAIPNAYIVTVGSKGTVLCVVGPKNVNPGDPTYAGQQVVLDALRTRLAGTDGPFVDPVTQQLSMFTSVPLPQPAGASLLYVFQTQASFLPQDRQAGFTSLLVDTRSGTVMMHYPAVESAVGTVLKDQAIARAVNSGAKLTTVVGLDGVRSLYRSVPIADTPYRLLVGQSESRALAAVHKSTYRNLVIGVIALLAVAIMGVVLQMRITRPIRSLRTAIRALAHDADAAPAPTNGPVELAAVAEAFNETTSARRRSDGLSRAILLHASDHVLVIDAGARLSFIAPRAQRELGLRTGQDAFAMSDLVHPDDQARVASLVKQWITDGGGDLRVEARIIDSEGALRHFDVKAQDLRNDTYVAGIVLTCRDVTERKEFEAHLAHQANHDPLTGLANRAAVLEHLQSALDFKDQQPVAVCFLDLDRFKLINDSHGHAVGDRVLAELARKLEDVVRPTDLVGRFGGDEFVVVGMSVSNEIEALAFAERIQQALVDPLHIQRRDLFVNGSIGIALGEQGDSAGNILRNADTAMYKAKERGRNCVAFFDEAMQEQAQKLLRTENDLHRAVERDELLLHFQPVMSLTDTGIVGVEALVRWRHPQRGLVSPADFIPVAEETGLVVPIGEWVLREACSWAAGSGERLGRPVRVSVNMSPRQLAQPGIVELVDEVLTTTGLPPTLLCLEVTETVLVQDAEAAGVTLSALHSRGIRVSIDDFGTGWSSLTYLQQFPVDEIKLDRSYVSRVEHDPTAATIVGSLVEMAHSMGLEVTAEGVETGGQDAFLRAAGCDHAQGFLYSKPVPGLEAENFLRSRGRRVPAPRGMMDA